ncbi:hypothetical protein [Desulfopila inferna]|uniref:hypothetical protein n=1 Tax=Desulfopila inferna TaxID=468528 RepID=UPI00196247E8|nr:hypothetical protein [Desulfopila inferna]MBM9605700.1 hypothetical protein [Desulfopila inferna]
MVQKKPPSLNKTLDLTVDDLIGKQSVRATFKLPQEVIDLLGVMSGQLGINKKTLFDQLIENTSILRKIAQEAKNYRPDRAGWRQKTFVISRNSLDLLNSISRQEHVSRNLLVEISIQRLLPVAKTELDKHNNRKELQKEMAEYLMQGNNLLRKSAQLLGKDDKLHGMIKEQIAIARKNLSEIEIMIEKGMVMEDW